LARRKATLCASTQLPHATAPAPLAAKLLVITAIELIMMTLQVVGEMTGDDGLGSQSYVPFSLPKDPDTAEDTTK